MKQIMNDLHQDHQHISALLTILKNKLATLEDGGRPNFGLMLEVLDYLDDYADGYHHAREDLLFSFMHRYHQECDGLIQQANNEHQQLADLTRNLRDAVEQVQSDTVVPLRDFIKRLRRYIEYQGHHLSFEEGKLFPLIEQLMTLEDWHQFAKQAPQRPDPLNEADRDKRYQQLYDALIDDLA